MSANGLATVSRSLEPKYSEALVNYRQQKYSEALQLLDELLAQESSIEFKELKALTLKESGKLDKAAEVYESLASSYPEQKATYQFELGMIHFQQKDNDQAHDYFEKALAGNSIVTGKQIGRAHV